MNRILVPVDFSPTSRKAFAFAVEMASRAGSSIILYHLYTPKKKRSIGVYHDVDAMNKKTELNSLKRLQRLRKKVLADKNDVVVSTIVGRTPLVNNILGFAEHHHIDLIIMGTQGASGLNKVTIGSVAGKVMENADVPVLLIPQKYELTTIEKIVFTTNFETADKTAFHFVFEIAKLYNALVTLVNLMDPYAKNKKAIEKNIESYGYILQREFSDSKMQFRQLKTTSVENTMENLHDEIPFDLMVMARRKLGFADRLFRKSFTKKMAFVTRYPLLIIPGQE